MRVGIDGFEPSRLTQIRVERGLSKINLGRMVERSPSTITKWENGSHSPDARVMDNLSKVLNCHINWFTKPILNLHENNPVFFRTLANTAKDLCDASEIYMGWFQEISFHLQQYLDYPTTNIPHLDVKDYRAIDDETIEQMASKCRKTWGLNLAPISDLLLVMENAGVVCSRFEQGSALMDGYSQWNEREERPYVIFASDKNNFFRSRFDAAHELGHLVLHRYIERIDGINFKPIESQAHKFTACFMLPEESFSVELSSHPTLENFIALKNRWGMSAQSMILRAKELQLISPEDYQRLYKGISARGWRKGEPLDDAKRPESVRLIPRCINLLIESGTFTKNSLIEKFKFPKGDLEDICSLPKGFLSESAILNFKTKIQLKKSLSVPEVPPVHSSVIDMFSKK